MKRTILLLGFGGPERPEDVRPFLDSVLQGVNIPEERLKAVSRHYELAGPSPYNSQVFRIQKALERLSETPVFVGFRHSSPSIEEACERLKKEKAEKTVCFILAPFRCAASFEKYKAKVDPSLNAVFTAPFHTHPLFIEAQASVIPSEQCHPERSERVEGSSGSVDSSTTAQAPPLGMTGRTFYIFSAHSIPQKMDDESAYSLQFRETASLVAKTAGLARWEIAYQSRSGNPKDPWLEPSLEKALERVDRRQFDSVCAIPVGFLVDNVEITYDLDIELKAKVEQKGFVYQRASPVIDHPTFIQMILELVHNVIPSEGALRLRSG